MEYDVQNIIDIFDRLFFFRHYELIFIAYTDFPKFFQQKSKVL